MELDFSGVPTVWPALLRGALVTLQLTVAVLLIATPIGCVLALLRNARSAPVRGVLIIHSPSRMPSDVSFA